MEKLSNKPKRLFINTGIVFVIFIFSIPNLFAGGPWPQKKGVGYFKLSEWWIKFDKHYTDSGKLDPNVTTGIFTTAFYGEYGLTNRFTIQTYFPLLTRNYMNNLVSATTKEVIVPGDAVNAIGDVDIMFKYGLTNANNKIPISVTLTLGIPLGKSQAGALNNLQTGDGEFNQMIQFDAGSGYRINEHMNGYSSAYLGFNHRTQGFSEELRFGIETGLGFFNQKLWIIGRLFGIESLKNGDLASSINSTSIFANNTEYSSYSIEGAYYITKNLGVTASFASAFRGEIIAAAPSYSVGIFYDMSK